MYLIYKLKNIVIIADNSRKKHSQNMQTQKEYTHCLNDKSKFNVLSKLAHLLYTGNSKSCLVIW